MAADILTFNPIRENAYSDSVRFDMSPPRTAESTASELPESVPEVRENPELSVSSSPSRDWELDVRALINTNKWLSNYGLKKNRLDMFHIMPQIGFKQSDDFVNPLKKPISSRYAEGLFQKYLRSDGKTFNVSCSKEKLRQLEQRLSQAIGLYKRRLEWLTTESRRIFGVVEEKSISIVLDIKNMSPQQFDQYKCGLERVLQEQVTRLAKFNLIRATEDLASYMKEMVPVSSDSVNGAVKWLWGLSRTDPVANTSTCEAVLKAVSDPNVDAVYLFTEGSSCDSSRELLKEKLSGARVPVHVVSFNCSKADTVKFLKNLTKMTGGRFHAYAVVMEMDSYETNNNVDSSVSHSNVILKKKTYGGVPPGAGMREDVIRLFEELEDARTTLNQVQNIITQLPDPRTSIENIKNTTTHSSDRSETYMSSREWLNKYGLRAKKLGFYDVLAGVAFKHRDGVVEIKEAPEDQYQTDALRRDKLINARYCDKFPCVRWKDGQVVHVQVTPEMHRTFEQRVNLTLNAVQQRIDWLQQGSRELFGTVIEDQIYILVDTSASMAPHIQFVKDKLFVLMQEQLRHKQKFNLIAFDSKAAAWQSRLVDVNEKNLHQAWQWIKGLQCRGSTNTLTALRQALADPQTQAVYLLTDGRPDQPPKSILAQVHLHPHVPIHTISFNCSDRDANQFLHQLAKDTAGRFHYYSENGLDPEGPEPWESEDIRLLRIEQETAYRNLEKIAQLRDECAALAWRSDDKKDSIVPSLNSHELFRRSESSRPGTATGSRFSPAPPGGRSPRAATSANRARLVVRPQSGGRSPRGSRTKRPLTAGSTRSTSSTASVAGHTRTSLLRTLNSSGQFDKEWLLPETKQMFDRQWDRQQHFIQEDERKLQRRSRRRKKLLDPMSMSSKKWLSRNGLAALKLTILDALAPTLIPHEPTYVPILNKHVLSKVFDDILPIAHASGNRKRIRIVNPQGVDLKGYIARVERAETRYRKRLDTIVWNALPASVQEELGEGPVSYITNRSRLDKALDEAGWPVQERDVVLLESEIRQAQIYIKQAQDLLDTSTAPKDDDARSVSSAGSRSEKKKTTARARRVFDLMKGQRIIGRNDQDGFYYPGSVIRCTDMRHSVVEYDELGKQKVPTRFVIPMSGAISVPHLVAGDYVLARVVNQDTNVECYVPGIVQMTPRTIPTRSKYFTVVLYTGQRDHFMRSFLVKISKLRYLFLVRYIQELSPREDESDRSPSRSRSPSPARSEPVEPAQDESEDAKQERIRLERWQRHLEEMQREQKKAQKRLKRQARKLEKLRLRLREGRGQNDREQRRLLEMILQETKKTDDRTQEWVQEQSVEIALDKEGGDILVSSGDKGVLISQTENLSSIILELRKTRPRLKAGEEVLARWSDEGWYYRGTINQRLDDYCYYVEDSVGNLEKIYREDILADSDDTDIYIQPKDTVIALHPNYTFSYAPGVVLETESTRFMQVRFYDGHEARVPRDELYHLPAAKFELDVAYIVKSEDQWVGQAVVARNDDTGVYQLGATRERIGDGRQYVVERSDGQLAIQVATCIFGAFTKRHPLSIGDHVLAIVEPKTLVYLPGTITDDNGDKLVVEFCNGFISHHIDPKQCFWLSRDYFKNAVEFYNQRQTAMAGGETAGGTVFTNNNERVTTKTTYELIEEKVDKIEITSENEDEIVKTKRDSDDE